MTKKEFIAKQVKAYRYGLEDGSHSSVETMLNCSTCDKNLTGILTKAIAFGRKLERESQQKREGL